MKQILFIEMTQNKQMITLPYKFSGPNVKATLINWDFSPIQYTMGGPNNGSILAPRYFQLRFDGGLESNFISNVGDKSMIQIPLLRLDGWPTANQIPIPVVHGARLSSRFQVEVFGEGMGPDPFPFLTGTRLLMWILIEDDVDSQSIHNSMTYIN